jgi:hypothetical protein
VTMTQNTIHVSAGRPKTRIPTFIAAVTCARVARSPLPAARRAQSPCLARRFAGAAAGPICTVDV